MYPLRPSLANAWTRCAGYVAMNANVEFQSEEGDTEVRDDGIAAHWLAKQLFHNPRSVEVGGFSPNDREITEEMFLAVEEYLSVLPSDALMEQTIRVSEALPGVTDGSPDAYHYHDGVLHVWDFKYGFTPVDEWRNLQLSIYALTLWRLLFPLVREFRLTIVQPRCPHRRGTTRTWSPTHQQLLEIEQELLAAVARCNAPNLICTVNPSCGGCGAAHACPSLQAAAMRGIETSYAAVPFEMEPAQIGYELNKLLTAQKHIENRINGLSTQAEALVRKGHRIPGFDLVRRATRWRWRKGAESYVKRLGELFGVDVMQEPRLKTVAKLRDAFPVNVQQMYAEQPAGELKLAPTDPNEAVRAFLK